MITQESWEAHRAKIAALRHALRDFIMATIESSSWDMSKERDRMVKQMVAVLGAQLHQLNTFAHPNSCEEDYELMYKQTSQVVNMVRAGLYDR